MSYPPKISDNILALCEIKRKQLEWKFRGEKEIVEHNPFPETEALDKTSREELDYIIKQMESNSPHKKRKNYRK